MTSINTSSLTNGYYQLSGQGSGNSTNGNNSASNVTNTLIQALSSPGTSTSSGSNDAYLLSLSPQAQKYLNGTSNSSSSDPLLGGAGSFTLSTADQQKLSDIVAKYKNAPYTQDTFNQIQNDLKAAGLDTNTLTLKDQAKSFNPTSLLINALNGGTADNSVSGIPSASDEQSKSGNFIQQIISQWKAISTTADTASKTASDTSAAAVTPVASGSGA